FFQAEDGIRDDLVTGVQTCALPISVDFSMKVGGISEVVDVQAGAVELQTQDAVTGQVVDRRFVNDLPLIGRSVLDLAYLTPGIKIGRASCRERVLGSVVGG